MDVASTRAPPAAWEAYLLIGVFPRGSAHAWCKVHVFVGRAAKGRHCLSALEALDGPGERVVLVAAGGDVKTHTANVDEASCSRAHEGWGVVAPGVEWHGFPGNVLRMHEPSVEARCEIAHVGRWVRLPGIISYFTGFGALRWHDAHGESAGVGLLEHAWGGAVPFDVARFAPRRWQWDVLALDGGGMFAGLSVAGFGLRAMGTGGASEKFATGRRSRVRVRGWHEEAGRSVPASWEGKLSTCAGTLRYEARAATPVAPMVPGGGFLGTTWEGDLAGRPVRGTGFTEYRAVR